jgi:hypothetical protein
VHGNLVLQELERSGPLPPPITSPYPSGASTSTPNANSSLHREPCKTL